MNGSRNSSIPFGKINDGNRRVRDVTEGQCVFEVQWSEDVDRGTNGQVKNGGSRQ